MKEYEVPEEFSDLEDTHEEVIEIEVETPKVVKELESSTDGVEQRLREAIHLILIQKEKIQELQTEHIAIPLDFVREIFDFEFDETDVLRLTKISSDQWNAVRCYILLYFKMQHAETVKFEAGINFLKKGLGISNKSVHNALKILRQRKLIKTRMEGKSLHAIKHYITMN